MKIKLYPPQKGSLSLEEAILKRSSIREYSGSSISIRDLSQILWSAYGTKDSGYKTVPSAGAIYPLKIYISVSNVENLTSGLYKYISEEHSIELIKKEDISYELFNASLKQEWILKAPLNIIITGDTPSITRVYGDRGIRYMLMEAGHVSQNIYLQAAALELGTVAVGAFIDKKIKDILNLQKGEEPLYIMPIGKPSK